MLSKILSKDQCAACRFCCSFVRSSTWETPLFEKEQLQRLMAVHRNLKLKPVKQAYTFDLSDSYKTDSADEEAACPFLDPNSGCTLSEEDKPFDCKIWPLRIMKKNKDLVIALTPTCPSVNQTPLNDIKHLVLEEKIGEAIYDQALLMPSMIKDYKKGFPVLMTRHDDSI